MSPPFVSVALQKDEEACALWDSLIFQEEQLSEVFYTALLQTPYLNLCPLEVSIRLTDDPVIQKLNAQYRQKNKPTNVLSFPTLTAEDIQNWDPKKRLADILLLGDIVLSWSTLQKEALEKGLSLKAYGMHLLVHGFFHLLGYDHEEEGEAEHMQTLERTCLQAKGWLFSL